MKQKLLKTFLVAFALVTGSMGVKADLNSTTKTYDFESEQPFVTTAGAGGATRITLSTTTVSGWDSNVLDFSTAGNAGNGSAAAKFDFSSLVDKAVKVDLEFDLLLGNNNSGTFSIGDASLRDVAGIKGTWGYSSTGAIWNIGINRGKLSGSKNNTNNFRINGVDLGSSYNTYLTNWLHVALSIDVANKKVTYKVTVASDGKEIASGTDVGYLSSASSCSQIDLFSGDNSLHYYLDNLKITSYEDNSQTYYDYTIKYIYNDGTTDTEIKTAATRNGLSGSTPELLSTDKDAVWYNEEKYIYQSDNASTTTIEENSVVNVSFRKAEKYSYTVNNSFGQLVSTGIGVEGEYSYVPFPRYINKDGSLYTKNSISSQYRYSFIPTENNQVVTLDYTDANIKNVVYFSEGENISGATATSSGGNMVIRSSNAACGYAASDIDLTTLTPGKYLVNTVAYSNSSGGLTLNFAYGEETLTHQNNGASNALSESQEITVNTACTFTWKASGNSKNGLDYIYIQKTADLATVSAVGFATYSPSSNVAVPENVKVYTVTVNAEQTAVTLNPVAAGSVVAAGTGYVIEATEGTYPFAVSNEAVSVIGDNALKVSDGSVTVAAGDNIYVLAQRSNGNVGFSKVAANVTIPAGKAYLQLSSGGEAKASFLSFGGVTAIESVEANGKAGNNEYYTLQGVRTTAPVKGLYIVNGKKVVVK